MWRQEEAGEGGRWGRGNYIRIKRDFMSPHALRAQCFSEKYGRINYESFLFTPLPVHLPLPRLPYPIYFEALSVLSPGQISNLSASLPADSVRGAVFGALLHPDLPSFWALRMVAVFRLPLRDQVRHATDRFWPGWSVRIQGKAIQYVLLLQQSWKQVVAVKGPQEQSSLDP